MTIIDADSSMERSTPPRSGWAIAALVMATLLALILVSLSIGTLLRNRRLTIRNGELSQALVSAEATRANQPDILREELTQAQQSVWPILSQWPTSNDVAQALASAVESAHLLGADVVRIEPLVLEHDHDAAPTAVAQRYLVELRGTWASILRFAADLARGELATLRFDSVDLTPGDPPRGLVKVTVYASDLGLLLPAPTPEATPSADSAVVAEILRLESMMHAAEATRSWEAYLSYGEQIRQLDPDWATAVPMLYQGHVKWAQDLAAQGDLETARAQYQQALQLQPDGWEALQALAALDQPTPTAISTVTPAPATPSPTPTAIVYTVRYGDTLIGIAARYGVSVADLMAANSLGSTTIYANQTLVIPQR